MSGPGAPTAAAGGERARVASERAGLALLEHYERSGYLAGLSLTEEIRAACRRDPARKAVIAPDGELSYGELDHAMEAWAAWFAAQGLAAGDQVLLQLPNGAAYAVSLLALMRLGAVPTLLLPSHRQAEVASVAHQVRPVAYIGSRDLMGFDAIAMVETMGPSSLGIERIWADAPQVPGSGGLLPGLDLRCDGAVPPSPQSHHRAVALNLLSGGTTSEPKIIPRIHEAYAYNARTAAHRCGVGESSVYMAVLSASHDFPLANPGLLGTLLAGGTAVLCHSAAFDEAFAAIEAHRVTITAIVPAVAELWAQALEWYPADLGSLERILIGAARLDPALGQALMSRTGARIQQGYGLGEGITTFTSIDDPPEVALTTVGTPISPGDSLRIVDPQGRELGPGQPGEIIEKGPYTFLGYGGVNPARARFTPEGYFMTGDRGLLDAAGNLIIRGRVAEQINRLGENVSPQEIESLLERLDAVHEAAVLGLPDPDLGERSVAVIVPTPPGDPAGPGGPQAPVPDRQAVLEAFQAWGVARYKVPDQVVIVEAIPRTNIGKADKRALAEMIQSPSRTPGAEGDAGSATASVGVIARQDIGGGSPAPQGAGPEAGSQDRQERTC